MPPSEPEMALTVGLTVYTLEFDESAMGLVGDDALLQ